MMNKATVYLCAAAVAAFVGAEALGVINYNSSRSNRGKLSECRECYSSFDGESWISIARQPSGYRREKAVEGGVAVFRAVPKGRYALMVRSPARGAATLDGIETDGGPIECDWSADDALSCSLVIESADRPDVTFRLFTCGEGECEDDMREEGITESESSTSSSGQDRPAAITESATESSSSHQK